MVNDLYIKNLVDGVRQNNLKMKIRPDLIISLGHDCFPATILRYMNLRFYSSPLDWMVNYSLDSVINLMSNDFENFFKNRKVVPNTMHGNLVDVEDLNNKMIDKHHFPLNKDINEFYENEFFPKMKSRWFKLKDYIEKSNNIMFVSFFRYENNKTVEKFINDFSVLFNTKKYYYVSIRNSNFYKIKKIKLEGRERIFIILEMKCMNDTGFWNPVSSMLLRNMRKFFKNVELTNKIDFKLEKKIRVDTYL